MIVGAYFDESEAEGCFCVAGYLANYTVWMHLDWKWEELLKKWKVDYFKASECNGGLGEFAQYRDNPEDRKGRLKEHEKEKLRGAMTDFVDAICKVQDELSGVGAVAITEDFQRFISEDREARHIFGSHPYYLCLQLSLVAASIPIREANGRTGSAARIKPIFDSHKEYGKYTRPLFKSFCGKNPKVAQVLLPPDHKSDVAFRPLQVADLVAYEARKLLVGNLRTPKDRERTSMSRLMPGMRTIYKLDYEILKKLLLHQIRDAVPINPAIEGGVIQ